MEHRVQLNLATTAVVVGLGIAVSLLTSTVVAARAYQTRGREAAREWRSMSVKGSVRQRITSDRAVWRITVRGEGPKLTDAYASLDGGIQKVKAYLAAQGFPDAAVEPGPIETTTYFARDSKGYETRETVGYGLSRDMTITTVDVRRVHRAAGEVTSLLQDGVLVLSSAPEYVYTDLAALKRELMGLASQDARARADEIAAKAGCRIAEVSSAHMGVIQITQPYSTDVSDSGLHDTSTIEKDVQAVVSLTFHIEPS